MTYELAKELKEAGLKQFGDGDALVLHRELPESEQTMSVIPWCQYVYLSSKGNDALYAPTLSELIEACGLNDLWALFQNMELGENRWCAQSRPDYRKQAMSGFGSTPEEAVAMLYLALHGKRGTTPSVEGK